MKTNWTVFITTDPYTEEDIITEGEREQLYMIIDKHLQKGVKLNVSYKPIAESSEPDQPEKNQL